MVRSPASSLPSPAGIGGSVADSSWQQASQATYSGRKSPAISRSRTGASLGSKRQRPSDGFGELQPEGETDVERRRCASVLAATHEMP